MKSTLPLKSAEIVYVTRDLERALAGLDLHSYSIITNATPFAKRLAKKHKNITLIAGAEKLDTHELLAHPKTFETISALTNPHILVFKNTLQIERLCREKKWHLLNPSAELANRVEEKISQVAWLGDCKKYLPPHRITTCKHLTWSGEKYIVQFNRAHTGSGTLLIASENQIKELQNVFPNREVRITERIIGPALTNNNVVWGDHVLVGNINYQITGLSPFTDQPFATVGNDWALPQTLLNNKQRQLYYAMATEVGQKLAKEGWRGLFGIDVMLDQVSGRLYLIEINARQPASTTYESTLQKSVILTRQPVGKNLPHTKSLTTFQAHLASLLEQPYNHEQLTIITDGAQVIQRVTPMVKKIMLTSQKMLAHLDLTLTPYTNIAPGSDLLRIQSKHGIMRAHDEFNYLGTEIAYALDLDRHRRYRAGVIIIRDNKLLLMKRVNQGLHYYSIPGGKPERNETLERVAVREASEETGLRLNIDHARVPLTEEIKKRGVYFFTKDVKGVAKLGGPEVRRNSPENFYELQWIDRSTLQRLTLRQAGLKPALLTLLK